MNTDFISIIIILLFLIPYSAYGVQETFYLTNTGRGTNAGGLGAFISPPKSLAQAMSPAQFNTAANWTTADAADNKIGYNDEIKVYDDDGAITTTLVFQGGGGAVAKPIVLTAGIGEIFPLISGADVITDIFTSVSGEIYKTSFTPHTDPKAMYEDDNLMKCSTHDQINNSISLHWVHVAGSTYSSGGMDAAKVNAVFDHSGGVWHELTQVFSSIAMPAGTFYLDVAGDNVYVHATGNENPGLESNGFIHMAYTYKTNLARSQCYYDMVTNELYIRTNNGQLNHTLTYSARSYGVNINGNQYVTVTGLGITKQNANGVYSDMVSADSVNIIHNNISFTGERAIYLTASVALSTVNVASNILTYNPTRYMDINISGGQNIYPLIYLNGDGTISASTVRYNYINGYSSGVAGSGNSAERNGIVIGSNIVNNGVTVTANEVTGIDHGIYLSQSGQGCLNTVISYNYVHDIGDDAIWVLACSNGILTDNVKIYANVLANAGDDGIALNGTSASMYNNTIINPVSNALEFANAGSTHLAVFNNNIVQISAGVCTGAGDGVCAVSLKGPGAIASTITADNNLYYSPEGLSDTIFFSHSTVIDNVGFASTFSQWRALSNLPDKNSYFNNPEFNSNYYSISDFAKYKGKNLSSQFNSLLYKDAVWNTDGMPALKNLSASEGWDIGAYHIEKTPKISIIKARISQ